MKRSAAFLLVTIAVVGCRSGSPTLFRTADALEAEVSKVSCDGYPRIYKTKELFERFGGEARIVEYKRASNVLVELAGNTKERIVVGAHYDKTTLGCGAIDNWTGVVMLAKLVEFTKANNLNKSYTFVAFGGEERDLIGSRAMAAEIANSGSDKPCAMVNLDSFGFDKTWALKGISDSTLLSLASDVERGRGGSFSIRDYRGASSDSKAFQLIDVPSITFSGLNSDWRDYLHRETDQVVNIDFLKVADNYLFLRAFLKRLDSVSCESLRKKPTQK